MGEPTPRKDKELQDTKARELLEYHTKIKKHIDLLRKVATDLDVVDMVYKMWDWVDEAGITTGDNSQKLADLLDSFEKGVGNHFFREEKELVRMFDQRGATEYSSKLRKEHGKIFNMFSSLKDKLNRSRDENLSNAEKNNLMIEIKNELGVLLNYIQKHAMEEEDAFFSVDHNI